MQDTVTAPLSTTGSFTGFEKNKKSVRFNGDAYFAVVLHASYAHLSVAERLLLSTIAAIWVNAQALAWPSHQSIARMTGFSVRYVGELQNRLIAIGHLVIVGRSNFGTNIVRVSTVAEREAFQPQKTSRKPAAKKYSPPRHSAKTKSADKEPKNLSSPNSSHSPSVSQELEIREKEQAAEPAAAVTLSPALSKGVSEGNAEQAQGIKATLEAFPELAKLATKAMSFAPILRGLNASAEDFENAVALAMSRRRAREARDAIMSLRYFVPAIEEVRESRNQTGGDYGQGRRIQTGTRDNSRTTAAPAGDAQQLDWRGLPVKKIHRFNGTGYDIVS